LILQLKCFTLLRRVNEIKKKLTVWVVLDRKAGHRSLTMGMLGSLRYEYSLRVTEVRYRAWTRPLGRLLQRCWPLGFSFACCGMAGRDKFGESPDIIIGSGGGVQWAVAALGKKKSAFSIFIGSPRSIPVSDYGMVIHYDPSLESSGVVLLPALPGPINHETTALAAKNFIEGRAPLNHKIACCMIGGNGAGYEWSEKDGNLLGDRLNEVAAQKGLRWVITTSRRTPREMESALRNRLSKSSIYDACWAGEGDARRVVAAYLGLAERVLVSEDSMSMMHEAMASGIPVSVFSSNQHRIDPKHENFILKAEYEKWIQRLRLDNANFVDSFCSHSSVFDLPLDAMVCSKITPLLQQFFVARADKVKKF
jgi:mitochondrial fission protein ELM1